MHRDGSSVMFPLGSWEVLGLATSDPPRPNDPVGIDLTPTPIPAANLHIQTRQMTTEMALSTFITVSISIQTSMFPFEDRCTILQTSLSKFCQSPMLFKGGHLIFGVVDVSLGVTFALRDWVLWYTSWPCFSCVWSGSCPVHCSCLPLIRHFKRPWWIFNLCKFYHTRISSS